MIVLEDEVLFADERHASLLPEMRELVDALSPSETELRLVLARLSQFPVTAGIFLRLLRHNELCNNTEALFAESLAYSTLQAGSEFKHWLSARKLPAMAAPVADSAPLVLVRENDQLHIRFNRPDTRNAYSIGMRDALYEALLLLQADSSLARCVISGEGDCFCVGGDLTEFGISEDPAAAHLIRQARPVARIMLEQASRIECHVHRACIGSGIELPACAGRLTATADTFFQLPELSMGLIPGAGGTVSILRRIGRHRLAWWVLSGKRINAGTALEWRLIDAIVD